MNAEEHIKKAETALKNADDWWYADGERSVAAAHVALVHIELAKYKSDHPQRNGDEPL